MEYLSVVNTITSVILTIAGVFTIYTTFFYVVGLFFKKKFPKAKLQHKYGIVISARNEGKVIANLVDSINKQNYPKDKLHVFVVAHNCTDNTADEARKLGATVYEYNNPDERTKGYALKYLFEQIKKDYGIETFEGYFMFDADNILTEDYISKMNDAFEYNNCDNIITGLRNSKNFGTNLISSLYGILFLNNCRFDCQGRTVCGCSTRVLGTGHVVSSKCLKNGWNYVTLTEDTEFTADQIVEGKKVIFCADAMFYDEQPTTFKVMWRQRLRWVKGAFLVFFASGTKLLKKLFSKTPKREKGNKISTYDILVTITPFSLVIVYAILLQFVLVAMAPLFTSAYLIVWQTYALNIFFALIFTSATQCIIPIILFIVYHKKINNVSLMTKLGTIVLWPLFMNLTYILALVAIHKKVEWKAIPHEDTTSIEKIMLQNNKNKKVKKGLPMPTNDDGEPIPQKLK